MVFNYFNQLTKTEKAYTELIQWDQANECGMFSHLEDLIQFDSAAGTVIDDSKQREGRPSDSISDRDALTQELLHISHLRTLY